MPTRRAMSWPRATPTRPPRSVLSSVVALRAHSADPDAPVAVLGFSMGGSWAMWLATRQPDSIDAAVTFYGAQNIDFAALDAPVMGHFADVDPLVTDDELVEMQSQLLLIDKHVEFYRYAGTGHWFAEDSPAGVSQEPAATLAWDRTMEFLHRHAPTPMP